ncbi:Crp/Fnr family transcriptional regulator [Undibacterium sp. Ji67W]|uniref:Crp/Fnr family transcriptional regulator n=1 Tax=Undibacterium sp. Ji67W TaxID=3413042 RepID=UPI003BF27754
MNNSAYNPNQNHLLGALPDIEFNRLAPFLELVSLQTGDVLCESGEKLSSVYFPISSTISLQNLLENGSSSEVTGIGNEGMLGTMLLMGGQSMPSRAIVQIAGQAYKLRADILLKEFYLAGTTLRLLLRYTQALITQTTQTAVCNRHHTIEQQLCRWLLVTNDRVSTREIKVTQETIANILGVRREGVTEAAGHLQSLGYIHYRRGHITISNQRGLQELVCECHAVVKKEFARLMCDDMHRQGAHQSLPIVLTPIFPPVFVPEFKPGTPPVAPKLPLPNIFSSNGAGLIGR